MIGGMLLVFSSRFSSVQSTISDTAHVCLPKRAARGLYGLDERSDCTWLAEVSRQLEAPHFVNDLYYLRVGILKSPH